MIKSVRLQNFFSFEDETIELHPEANVFVGINGSGKSNVLKAFKLLQQGMAGRLRLLILNQWGGFDAIKFKGNKNDLPIVLTFIFDSDTLKLGKPGYEGDIAYQIEIQRQKSGSNYYIDEALSLLGENDEENIILNTVVGDERSLKKLTGINWIEVDFEDQSPQELFIATITNSKQLPFHGAFRKKLMDFFVYDYFDTTPGSKIRQPTLATAESALAPDGTNLPQLLNTIKINDKDNYFHILNHLKKVNVNFTGIDFNLIGGNIELMLKEAKYKSSVHVTHVSDGTLRFLCLMAIFFNENRGGFICIDEPELGLHPDMIKAVFDAMMSSTEKTQYLITTHSDHLLDLFGLENIRVVEKDDNNSTKVKPLDAKDFEGWYEVFSPGNMWRQGDFGGNRY